MPECEVSVVVDIQGSLVNLLQLNKIRHCLDGTRDSCCSIIAYIITAEAVGV